MPPESVHMYFFNLYYEIVLSFFFGGLKREMICSGQGVQAVQSLRSQIQYPRVNIWRWFELEKLLGVYEDSMVFPFFNT